MNALSNAHHFRKTVAGICMVAAPLALLLAMVFHPETGISENAYVIRKVGEPDAGQIEQICSCRSRADVPAVLGLMHMLREREVDFGHVGARWPCSGLLVLPWAFMAGLVILAFGLYRATPSSPPGRCASPRAPSCWAWAPPPRARSSRSWAPSYRWSASARPA